MKVWIKSLVAWSRSHLPVLLGAVIVCLVSAGCWDGTLQVPEAAALGVVGLSMMGVHLTVSMVSDALRAVAASGNDYRAGKPAAAVHLSVASPSKAPFTMTIAGEAEDVLAAATAISATPKVQA